MLTAEIKATTFAKHLQGRKIPGYTPRLYTDQELVRLADEFLKRTCWTDSPEELIALYRQHTARKAAGTRKANRARAQTAERRAAAAHIQGDLFADT